MKTHVFVVIFLALGLFGFLSCEGPAGPAGPPGPPGPQGPAGVGGEIYYFGGTLTSSTHTFISASPYGYYQVIVVDSRLSGAKWVDVWLVATDGSIYRPAPFFDDVIGVWYNVVYVGDGWFGFNSPISLVGKQAVVFYSPVTQKSLSIVDYQALFPELRFSREK